ncbi:Lrp/AsnC family transcriptional regulator [Haloterrigena sp. SYSU A558-1]|uniref:Lrp/AsnC family transcriptional regulator n=1 Tax=Haloterrigena gelatinilytica TaxID=2741724 RepID=A0A8J8GKK4_9EURY|nr:Lrp/AsnC family transcriptional regulator [Haloterrigena gelatinilytica]NUB91321.1 Lrp/AsnC family transcriptional regulator [Haloterrigena gelatinilytica]NUC72940.1 Lrp/AsnC family transcriptional regulator [Haloterrigena gelatinilytica]
MANEEDSSLAESDLDVENDEPFEIDTIDEGVLFALQRDARNATITEISEEVDVSPSTVRNRIDNMEDAGVIEGYEPKLNYEKAGFPLRLFFVCTSDPEERSSVSRNVLSVTGVVQVTEMITNEHNLYIETVSTSTTDLIRLTKELNEYGLTIHSSEIITASYSQPWGHFQPDETH